VPLMSGRADFEAQTVPLRPELLVHCYQMLGSVHDAEDLVQETMLRAWRAFDRFDPSRGSLRTWLYRIATNACLSALAGRKRRPLPSGWVARGDDPDQPFVHGTELNWLQPFPDAKVPANPDDPATVLISKGRLRLALIAAMQVLPPRQRATLILRDALGWTAAEVAVALDTTPVAVNSALQRARAHLAQAGVQEDELSEPSDPRQRALVDRYVAAFQRADVAELAMLLTEDAVLEMPPYLNWYAGRSDYARFIARVFATHGPDWRMTPLSANGQPAVAAYARGADGAYHLNTIQVFRVTNAGIKHNVTFPDPTVFDLFVLPRVMDAAAGPSAQSALRAAGLR
jgi:RNA polymerase sigma-70 factor, ECF subfamily